ncbi:hypothetical protein LEP1GSC060_0536 [Leptospira weilii serovar Ranarum str. ICFT]|uniref:Uncharacterized protein n=1 Tax=Leptospira weilii serovar Ranarum str. ICFT TaxID=1218598 RepID=N1WNA9_9LEPT|nr:hypothetical protein LEP1GSC060_0536 [Leptospira weilii serovar Ranarum str. ICFT]
MINSPSFPVPAHASTAPPFQQRVWAVSITAPGVKANTGTSGHSGIGACIACGSVCSSVCDGELIFFKYCKNGSEIYLRL